MKARYLLAVAVVLVAVDPVGLWCLEPVIEHGGGGRHGNRGLSPLSTRNRLQNLSVLPAAGHPRLPPWRPVGERGW
jgi:hypothetical protein